MDTMEASVDPFCARDFVERAPESVEVGVRDEVAMFTEGFDTPDPKEAKERLEGPECLADYAFGHNASLAGKVR
jgi:hypothetical protein